MYRIIYKSRATGIIDKITFRDILYTSSQMNRLHGINGALIATRSSFLQFLEGEEVVVKETFSQIEQDPRHTAVEIISSSKVTSPIFSDWRMRVFGLFEIDLELEKELQEKYGEENSTILLPNNEFKAIELAHDANMITQQ
jgi:hypothetical protein